METCSDGNCDFVFCDEVGLRCCADGCAQCCSDSECDDGDPCTDDRCKPGGCEHQARCGGGTGGEDVQCCPDGTCGVCCKASDCNDGVLCTVDTCQQGTCRNTASDVLCPGDKVCDPAEGCLEPVECTTAADCTSSGNPCETIDCVDNECVYSYCETGFCCGNECRSCCDESHCDDFDPCTVDICDPNGAGCKHEPVACPAGTMCCNGECAECCSNADCDNDFNPLPGQCAYGGCVLGQCVQLQGCPIGFQCCPDDGCVENDSGGPGGVVCTTPGGGN